jgi:hypothetical protein
MRLSMFFHCTAKRARAEAGGGWYPVCLLTANPILTDAGQWFLESGIREANGGFARYYRVEEGRNARVSTEITGYVISALLELFRRTGEARYLDAARKSGEFLADHCWDRNLRVWPFEHGEGAEPLAYFFDSGIIARALIQLYRAGAGNRFLDLAVETGHSMLRDFPAERGYHPILRLPGKTALEHTVWWSRLPGCFHLKAALPWFELREITGEPRFHEPWQRQLAFSLESWPELLGNETERLRIMDRLHAVCYYLEGLLAVGDQPECRDALENGIQTAARHLRDIAPEFARSDVYAQLLRVRLWAHYAGFVPLDEAAAREEANAIPNFRYAEENPRFRGGFCFGRRGGALTPYANPVSTGFALQALALWSDYVDGRFASTWHDLV